MYTTSSLFLKALSDAGITHAFVNWGSDHPALLEDLARTRPLAIVTCPNEMVALSAAQGYAQLTGRPAAVIVHVDVGTQAMAGALHNVDRGHVPVLIYAGASPFSTKGELRGGRNEWIMWLQDIPDQTAIVRQYVRHVAQINSGRTVSQVVARALQIATSEPKGPVYLWARREVMEEPIPASLMEEPLHMTKWPSVEPVGLNPSAAKTLAGALLSAKRPLIITSHYSPASENDPLLTLSTNLAVPIYLTCPSRTAVPLTYPLIVGLSYLPGGTHTLLLRNADVILVLDSPVPWIEIANGVGPSQLPSQTDSDGKNVDRGQVHDDQVGLGGEGGEINDGLAGLLGPLPDARVFVLDSVDPLQRSVNVWHVDAEAIYVADTKVALGQVLDQIKSAEASGVQDKKFVEERREKTEGINKRWKTGLELEEKQLIPSGPSYSAAHVLGTLRKVIEGYTSSGDGKCVTMLNEGISNYSGVWVHLRPDGIRTRMITSGGSSLGWALGASVGAQMGIREGEESNEKRDLIVSIVGDGSFLFGVPSTAYWMARRYNTPFLTIVLNNGGWKSPKLSMLGVHPTGHGSNVATGPELTVGFGPHPPDFAGIAVAASDGWAWGKRLKPSGGEELEDAMQEAIRVVQDGKCAVLDCVLEDV